MKVCGVKLENLCEKCMFFILKVWVIFIYCLFFCEYLEEISVI